MEFDNPGAAEPWGGEDNRSHHSEFSGSESTDKKLKKEKTIILGAKKKEKDKEKKKEKESRYAHLGDESSEDEEAKLKKSKKKGFQFGSAKKEKKEKKEKVLEIKELKDGRKKDKKEKDKEKSRLKLKKSKPLETEAEGKVKVEESCIFGVPLELAVERSKCHDGIKLPVVVRECILFIEENGLSVEGIYRSSGVKSKVVKLKTMYDTRQSVSLEGAEPAVVASLLKLFLRELPHPVLTTGLMPRFEEYATFKEPAKRLAGFKSLMSQLPEANRCLLEWIFCHMGHVIEREKVNKMTLQNVSIVLSPTMQISHRVLYCFFEFSGSLFGRVLLKKYVPPISGPSGLLPESPEGIEEEMRKQESLLEALHKEISLGVASKATEEQLWEQQRIVTQLKRNLRHALTKTSAASEPKRQDFDEELNFSLQTPQACHQAEEHSMSGGGGGDSLKGEEIPSATVKAKGSHDAELDISSPEVESSTGINSQEHRVTVQIHQVPPVHQDRRLSSDMPKTGEAAAHVTVIELAREHSESDHVDSAGLELQEKTKSPEGKDSANTVTLASAESAMALVSPSSTAAVASADSPAEPAGALSGGGKPPGFLPLKTSTPSSTASGNLSAKPPLAIFPLLPPPPPSSKAPVRSLQPIGGPLKGFGVPVEAKTKSKSLPRGLPSDGSVFDKFRDRKKEVTTEAVAAPGLAEKLVVGQEELLLLEEMRLKFEYEELLNLKSELERRKKTERREVAELQEEIATMQTLYQYRTYSVDSSEESGAEEEETQQVQADRIAQLRQLAREQVELEKRKMALLYKLQSEREACVRLRVSIRLEQERLKRKGL